MLVMFVVLRLGARFGFSFGFGDGLALELGAGLVDHRLDRLGLLRHGEVGCGVEVCGDVEANN
jgi:hypothetical protein